MTIEEGSQLLHSQPGHAAVLANQTGDNHDNQRGSIDDHTKSAGNVSQRTQKPKGQVSSVIRNGKTAPKDNQPSVAKPKAKKDEANHDGNLQSVLLLD